MISALLGSLASTFSFSTASSNSSLEGRLIASMYHELNAVVEGEHPSWYGYTTVFTPQTGQVSATGYVYFSDRKYEVFPYIPTSVFSKVEELYAVTVSTRGAWKRIVLRQVKGQVINTTSYSFEEIDPWDVRNLSTYEDMVELINDMRPKP